jgi:hypothetical protein
VSDSEDVGVDFALGDVDEVEVNVNPGGDNDVCAGLCEAKVKRTSVSKVEEVDRMQAGTEGLTIRRRRGRSSLSRCR